MLVRASQVVLVVKKIHLPMQERLESRGPFMGQEDPLEKDMDNPLQYSYLENSMDRGNPRVDYSP